jgi:hypothetical protein
MLSNFGRSVRRDVHYMRVATQKKEHAESGEEEADEHPAERK